MLRILVLISLLSIKVMAQCPTGAVREAAPFILLDQEVTSYPAPANEGAISGYSYDLWNLIWNKIKVNYPSCEDIEFTIYETNNDGLGVVAADNETFYLAAPTITSARAELVDFHKIYSFTKPYTGLGIMVNNQVDVASTIWSGLSAIFNVNLLLLLVMFVLFCLGVSTLVWTLDRCGVKLSDSKLFHDDLARGIKESFTWTLMAILNKPVARPTTTGNTIALVILGLFFVMIITVGSGATSTLLSQTSADVGFESFTDLHGEVVATVSGTVSDIYLTRNLLGGTINRYPSIDAMFDAFIAGTNNDAAVVYDHPILLYRQFSDRRFGNTKVLDEIFDRSNIGIAMSNDNTEFVEYVEKAMIELEREGVFANLESQWFREVHTTASAQDTTTSLAIVLGILAGIIIAVGLISILIVKWYLEPAAIEEYENQKAEEAGKQRSATGSRRDIMGAIFQSDSYRRRYDNFTKARDKLSKDEQEAPFIDEYEAPRWLVKRLIEQDKNHLQTKKSVIDVSSKVANIATNMEVLTGLVSGLVNRLGEEHGSSEDMKGTAGAVAPRDDGRGVCFGKEV